MAGQFLTGFIRQTHLLKEQRAAVNELAFISLTVLKTGTFWINKKSTWVLQNQYNRMQTTTSSPHFFFLKEALGFAIHVVMRSQVLVAKITWGVEGAEERLFLEEKYNKSRVVLGVLQCILARGGPFTM